MIHLQFTSDSPRRLPFYLAMEEWAARTLPASDYFFIWRVRPTVICGRNQEMDKEVDMRYCREAGIDVVRRRSGGGCVYADLDNFMFSYITPGDEITATFARYTTMVAGVLRSLGLDAAATGRNDILINGRKVSGNAFYHLPGRCIAHGTMLYDFDPAVMRRAITPSRAKLESKAVKSVESRVICLREAGITLSPGEFEQYAISRLCDSEILLSPADIEEITQIEQTYYDPTFLYRKSEAAIVGDEHIIQRNAHIENVGEVCLRILLDEQGKIARTEAVGDFFLVGDPEAHIFRYLKGVPFSPEPIRRALSESQPEKAMAGFSREALLRMLI